MVSVSSAREGDGTMRRMNEVSKAGSTGCTVVAGADSVGDSLVDVMVRGLW